MMFENNFHLQVVLDPLEPTTMAQKILDIWIIQSNDITTHGAGLVRQIFPKKYWKTKFNSAIRSTNIHKDVLSLINWLIFLAHNNTSPDQDVCTFVLIKDFSLQPLPSWRKDALGFCHPPPTSRQFMAWNVCILVYIPLAWIHITKEVAPTISRYIYIYCFGRDNP